MKNGSIADQFLIIKNSGKKIFIKDTGYGNVIAMVTSLIERAYNVEHVGQDNIVVSRREFREDYPKESAVGEKVFKTYPLNSMRIEWGTFDPTKEE